MIVDELDVMRVALSPDEADAPLIVDADRVSPFPITQQRFEAISRRHAQVFKTRYRVSRNNLKTARLATSPGTPRGALPLARDCVRLSRNERIMDLSYQ
jgi:hypothetical protein